MTWSKERALAQAAAKLANERHPDGWNKKQLIEASKDVYGGFGANPHKPIKTMEDVAHMGNAMANIDGHYPVGMSGCFVVGLNGGCGSQTCPVFAEGECDIEDEVLASEKEPEQ